MLNSALLEGKGREACHAEIRDWKRIEASRETITLDNTCRHAFEFLLSRIDSVQPPKNLVDIPDKPVLIFTDGAVELKGDGRVEATVGGVIIGDGVTEVFGSRVD